MSTAESMQLIAIGLQTIVFLFGGGAMVLRASSESKELRDDMKNMEEELKGLAKVITLQAVQAERMVEQSRRMTLLEQRVEDMRRGKGFVADRDATTVDREY